MSHVYVAQGRYGLLKIGATERPPAERQRSLRKEFVARGDAMARFQAVAITGIKAAAVESALLAAVGGREQIASGREWFRSGSFDNAVRAAHELADYYADPGRRAELDRSILEQSAAEWGNRCRALEERKRLNRLRTSEAMRASYQRRRHSTAPMAWLVAALAAPPVPVAEHAQEGA